MREFVLNDACLGRTLSLADAVAIAADVERGISALIAAKHAVNSMRLAASIHEIEISPGLTLAEVLTNLIRNTPDSGRLFARLATKFPVENDLDDDDFAALVNWSIPTNPHSISLLLCARSGRIATSLSRDAEWAVDPIHLAVATDSALPTTITTIEVHNVYSAANAAALAKRLTAAFVDAATPSDIWRARNRIFPHLDFAPRVESDLANLEKTQFESAVSRLRELNKASESWKYGAASPAYLSKITGESESTMNKYGKRRIFRSLSGRDEIFELHARLADGYRLHLREIPSVRRIEVGYIGPHLPIVSQ